MGQTTSYYYFNASRWVWTGHSTLPITYDSIRLGDGQGITLSKITKIALLSIFAFVYDILVMAVEGRLLKKAGQWRVENTLSLKGALLEQENLAAIVLSALRPEEARELFAQTSTVLGQAAFYRSHGELTDWNLNEISSYPNANGILKSAQSLKLVKPLEASTFLELVRKCSGLTAIAFPRNTTVETIRQAIDSLDVNKIKHVDFSSLALSDAEFFELIKKLPNLISFAAPSGLSDEQQIQVIGHLQNQLEAVSLKSGGDAVIRALCSCPRFTSFSIDGAEGGTQPTDASLNELAALQQLQRLTLHGLTLITSAALQAFCEQCPLQHLSLDGLRGVSMIQGEMRDGWLSGLVQRSQGRLENQRLLSLELHQRVGSISEADLQALSGCSSLRVLSLKGLILVPNLTEFFPKNLEEFHFNDWSNDDTVICFVRNHPSIQSIHFEVFERVSALDIITPYVIEKLGALNRPLTLHIRWLGGTERVREEQFRRYPQLNIQATYL